MMKLIRSDENPFLQPNKDINWESYAAFNPCVVYDGTDFHLLYRAIGSPQDYHGAHFALSTIGYAVSKDGVHFKNHQQLIKPEADWERFGCEDPRITFLNGKYYIFYTALSAYPFSAHHIRIGLAITRDFKKIEEKHSVTNFNSKAMALFPEKINGQMCAILTANTDLPPAKIAVAFFDKEEDLWSESYWNNWYQSLDNHVIPLLRSEKDHLEVGAPPLKTEQGWLLIYSYIQNYFTNEKIFGIEAVLLDLNDPRKIIGRIDEPLIFPEKEYELHGDVPDITFPSGALILNEKLYLYYGAADTTCCLAIGDINHLLKKLTHTTKESTFIISHSIRQGFRRYKNNPIISPRPEFSWEAKATFNPAAIYEDGKFHIIYRAMSMDDTSVLGYASSIDGIHITERLLTPIYEPRANFEKKLRPGNSGCEDPRITKLDDILYMFYTAYDGYTPRVAYTTIKVDDFLKHHWNWTPPCVITPPGVPDKDACLLPKKIDGKYVVFHRANDAICINLVDDLDFGQNKWLESQDYLVKPRKECWDNRKFGIAAPPIETPHGWIMLFHRVAIPGDVYKVEAALLDLNDPTRLISQTDATLLEPQMDYEKFGQVHCVVFPCGAVLLHEKIYLYYGGGDRVVGVARMRLEDLLKRLGV